MVAFTQTVVAAGAEPGAWAWAAWDIVETPWAVVGGAQWSWLVWLQQHPTDIARHGWIIGWWVAEVAVVAPVAAADWTDVTHQMLLISAWNPAPNLRSSGFLFDHNMLRLGFFGSLEVFHGDRVHRFV